MECIVELACLLTGEFWLPLVPLAWNILICFDPSVIFFPTSVQQEKLSISSTHSAGNTCRSCSCCEDMCQRLMWGKVLKWSFKHFKLFPVVCIMFYMCFMFVVKLFCKEIRTGIHTKATLTTVHKPYTQRNIIRPICWTVIIHSLNTDFDKDH